MAETQNNSQLESETFNHLSADNALTDPKTDRLGYASFALSLADSICKMNCPEGFVIAVYGSWGCGKSTLLNFLVHYLKQKPENEQPIIVPFNPWLFSGHQDITRRFFDQLQSVLSELRSLPQGWRERIADFAKIMTAIPLPYTQNSGAIAKLTDNQQKDISDLKAEVEDTLQQQHPRLVITVDDIDKLTGEEIRQLFRVLTAFPNFTNVVYLLVFDKEVVIKALAESQGIPGEAYLEKIVQVPFELPLPDKTLLRKLLFEKLNTILAETPKQLFDQTHWGNIYFQGIDHFITNPRDIVRLTNVLSVTYPVVKGEVNPVDFIAIESLRVFCPTIYHSICKNPHAFAGSADDKDFLSFTVEELKSIHNAWIAQLQDWDKEPVKRLLMRLFPKLEAVWSNTYYGAEYELIWRRQSRVCSLEVFPIYFCLALPKGEFSRTQIKAILAVARNPKAFGESLVVLAKQKRPDGTTQVRVFLERLEDYTETEVPWDCIPAIVQALFDVGDHLLSPEDEPSGMFDFGNDVRIRRIIWLLLRRQDEPARFEVLKAAISNGNALLTIVREIVNFGQQQGKYGVEQPTPEAEWIISAKHHKELEEISLKKVQVAAQQNSLLRSPGLAQILAWWQQWTSEKEVKQWVQKVISDDQGLVTFLEKFLAKSITQSLDTMVPKKSYRLAYKELQQYLDPSSIIDQVISLADKDELTKEQTTAIRQFIQEYDMRQQGKNLNELSAK